MAVAEQIQRTEIKMVEQEVAVEECVLTLSKEEAQFVLSYLGHTVVGSGLRLLSDKIVRALLAAGITYSNEFSCQIEGGIKYNCFRGIKGGY